MAEHDPRDFLSFDEEEERFQAELKSKKAALVYDPHTLKPLFQNTIDSRSPGRLAAIASYEKSNTLTSATPALPAAYAIEGPLETGSEPEAADLFDGLEGSGFVDAPGEDKSYRRSTRSTVIAMSVLAVAAGLGVQGMGGIFSPDKPAAQHTDIDISPPSIAPGIELTEPYYGTKAPAPTDLPNNLVAAPDIPNKPDDSGVIVGEPDPRISNTPSSSLPTLEAIPLPQPEASTPPQVQPEPIPTKTTPAETQTAPPKPHSTTPPAAIETPAPQTSTPPEITQPTPSESSSPTPTETVTPPVEQFRPSNDTVNTLRGEISQDARKTAGDFARSSTLERIIGETSLAPGAVTSYREQWQQKYGTSGWDAPATLEQGYAAMEKLVGYADTMEQKAVTDGDAGYFRLAWLNESVINNLSDRLHSGEDLSFDAPSDARLARVINKRVAGQEMTFVATVANYPAGFLGIFSGRQVLQWNVAVPIGEDQTVLVRLAEQSGDTIPAPEETTPVEPPYSSQRGSDRDTTRPTYKSDNSHKFDKGKRKKY